MTVKGDHLPHLLSRTAARRALSTYLEEPAARTLARIGVSPNAITLLGLLVAAASGVLVGFGYLLAGGAVLLASGALDLLDGALARRKGRVTRFGALLDSVADRVSEAAILLGILVFYLDEADDPGVILAYLALAGSLMVSYVRARAEGLGIDCEVGVMTRPERVVVLVIGLIVSNWWLPMLLGVLGLIAALTLLTSIHRLFHVWRQVKGGE